jgi:CheY-like chemotaxis protein
MKGRILAVDDEADIRNLVKMMLEAKGYEVITASNGDEAIVNAVSETPDIILLDIVMPGKSGFEACKIIKAQKNTKHIPVIMFSTLGRDNDKKMGADAGADGYIVKPFVREDMIAELDKHLGKIRPNCFSRMIGMTHEQIAGRKLLLEYDPTSRYEIYIRNFILEGLANGDSAAVFTISGSAIDRILKGNNEVDLIPIGTQVLLSPVLEKHAGKNIAIAYDSITDTILSDGFKTAYSFIKSTLERLADQKTTAIFLMNPNAHPSNETSSIRSLFGNHLALGKDGLDAVRLG